MKSSYQKYTAQRNFTNLTLPCNQHPDQEIEHYQQPICPVLALTAF